MQILLLNRHMRVWPTPCGGIEKEKAKSDLSNKIPLLVSFERSFYGLFLTKAALLPFLLTPASKPTSSISINKVGWAAYLWGGKKGTNAIIIISFCIWRGAIQTWRRSFIHKAHIFWEGHKILRNLHLTFVLCSASQK